MQSVSSKEKDEGKGIISNNSKHRCPEKGIDWVHQRLSHTTIHKLVSSFPWSCCDQCSESCFDFAVLSRVVDLLRKKRKIHLALDQSLYPLFFRAARESPPSASSRVPQQTPVCCSVLRHTETWSLRPWEGYKLYSCTGYGVCRVFFTESLFLFLFVFFINMLTVDATKNKRVKEDSSLKKQHVNDDISNN